MLWTEATLRAAATWQAFKEGKSLFETGAVSDTKSGQNGWQGLVRAGKRPLRVSVTFKSATDLETRCACAQNQATGAFCAHAVATGLATLAVKSAPPNAVKASQPVTSTPWQILLPLNWRDALSRGKLTATLAVSNGDTISPADDRLNAWLARETVARASCPPPPGITRSAPEKAAGRMPAPLISLNLDGNRVSTFLEAIADHPRLTVAKEQLTISIRSGERFLLADASRLGELIRLAPAPDSGPWFEIGAAFWRISSETATRLGEGTLPAALAAPLRKIANGQAVEIPSAEFFKHLDSWQEWVAFPDGSWLDALHFTPAPLRVELSLEGSLQHLDATLLVRYQGAPAVPPGLGKVEGLPRLLESHCEVRNTAAEQRAADRFSKAGFQPQDYPTGHWVLKGESAVLEFLTRHLPDLRQDWSVSDGERFAHVQKQVAIVSPKIEILGSGEDWLSFDLTFQTSDGTSFSATDVRQLLRSGRQSGKVAGGRHLVISTEVSELIDPLFEELELRQENGRFTASARSGELIREIRDKLSKSQNQNIEEHLFNFDSPPSFHAELRPYQQHGAAWLQDRIQRFGGALLADDMGLGKTIQTIALAECLFSANLPDSGVILVLATASLLGNWKAEFAKFAPGRTVRILHGNNRDAERGRVTAGDVILTSYGTLARDLAWHLKREYRAVVVDYQ